MRRALSQADLAARSGVGQANLSRIEAGKQRARPSTARRLAEALGVEPAALMGIADDGTDPADPATGDGGGR